MKTSEFLFPYDLELTPTKLDSMLVIGSCLIGSYIEQFRKLSPSTHIDYVLFNNAADLPDIPARDPGSYDLHFIQIPIRSVLNDSVVRVVNFNDPEFAASIVDNAKLNLEMLLSAALKYNVSSGVLTFISNFIVPQQRITPSLAQDFSEIDMASIIEELNNYLAFLVAKYRNAFIADVNSVAGSMGKQFFLDDTVYFYTHGALFNPEWHEHERMPYWTEPLPGRIEEVPSINSFYENKNEEFLSAVYRLLIVGYRIANQIDQVKLVIFDLDNTLWRGQIAEHYRPGQDKWPYADGWPMGLWETIHHLRWRGILTSICSKNDIETVNNYWDNAIQLPWITLDDFICPKINWSPKPENIQEILMAVGLTAKSVVFVDDNPVEREAVKLAFPEMRVIGSNPFLTRRILLRSAETRVLNLTDESKNRESMVKSQFLRNDEKQAMPREQFLSGLGCKLHLRQLANTDQPEYTRCLELINKTNQFNTTGERWRADDFARFVQEGQGQVYFFTVSDKFVNYGLVGVVVSIQNNIHQFVMSCRVLGMDVEIAVLKEICELIRSYDDGGEITARLVETKENTPCRQVYAKAGFEHDAKQSLFILAEALQPVAAEHVLIEEILVSKSNFNFEKWYLHRNLDVAQAMADGGMLSAEYHYENFGKDEGRFCPDTF
jgi:FkbH-like protein